MRSHIWRRVLAVACRSSRPLNVFDVALCSNATVAMSASHQKCGRRTIGRRYRQYLCISWRCTGLHSASSGALRWLNSSGPQFRYRGDEFESSRSPGSGQKESLEVDKCDSSSWDLRAADAPWIKKFDLHL